MAPSRFLKRRRHVTPLTPSSTVQQLAHTVLSTKLHIFFCSLFFYLCVYSTHLHPLHAYSSHHSDCRMAVIIPTSLSVKYRFKKGIFMKMSVILMMILCVVPLLTASVEKTKGAVTLGYSAPSCPVIPTW